AARFSMALSRRSTVSPSRSGSSRSSRMTSGEFAAAARSASSPVPASPTTSTAAPSSMPRRPSRTIGWSSTIRTRAGSGCWSDEAIAQGELCVDVRAAALRLLDKAGAAEESGGTPYAGQAQPPGALGGREAHAVVPHVEMDAIGVSREDDFDAGGTGVLAGVGERLLQNSENRRLDRGRQAR